MEYPYHIRDVHISDPFILADPVTKKYRRSPSKTVYGTKANAIGEMLSGRQDGMI